MVLVTVAFIVGTVFGGVLVATLIARGQKALALTPLDLEQPVRPAEQWLAERGDALSEIADQRIERFEQELAKRIGREAAAIARDRRASAYEALRPAFGIRIRVKA